MKKIKVLNLSALSYSGTTWLNLLLGSHPEVFTLGPPHRVWALREEKLKGACLVHGESCKFWSGFGEFWNQTDNFFIALSEYSGKSIFLMDNASQDFIDATMRHPDIEVLSGRYVRDARAITASYARKMADKGVSYIESIQPKSWFYTSFMSIPSIENLKKSSQMVVHYEEAVDNQAAFLKKAGDFLRIEYEQDAFKFWEADHHITSGNQGPIAMIKLHQGLNVGNFESREIYEKQLERLKEYPTKAFSDERWRDQLSLDDLTEFDKLMGKKNAELGYQRDHSGDSKSIMLNNQNSTYEPKSSKVLRRIKNCFKKLLTNKGVS